MFNFDINDSKVLIKATKSRRLSNVEFVIQKFKDAGKDLRHEMRTTDRQGNTAIYYAAKQRSLRILRLLLKYADRDTINAFRPFTITPCTPLMIVLFTMRNRSAVGPRNGVICSCLWEREDGYGDESYCETDASTSSDDDDDCDPVTKRATKARKRAAIVSALLSAGADPNFPNFDCNPPLTLALLVGWWEGAKILLEAGACAKTLDYAGDAAYYHAMGDLSTFEELARRGGLIKGFRTLITVLWHDIPNKLEIFKIWAKYGEEEPLDMHPDPGSYGDDLPEYYDRKRLDGFTDLLHLDIECPPQSNCLVTEFLLRKYKTKTSTLIVAYHLTIYYQNSLEDECSRATLRSTSAMIRKMISERFQDRDTVIENALEFLTIEEVSSEDYELFIESIKKHNIPFSKLRGSHLIHASPRKQRLVEEHDDLHFSLSRYFKVPDEFDPLLYLLMNCRHRKGLDIMVQKLIVAGMPVTTRSLCFAFWWASFKRTNLKNCLTTILDNCPPADHRERLSLVKDDLARPVAAMAVLEEAHYNLFILLREGFPAHEVEKALIDMRDNWEINRHLELRGAGTDLPGFKILESFLPVVSKELALKYKDYYRPKESPKSLMDLCRINVRQNYGFRKVQEELQNLELDLSVPSIIVEYLRYDGDPEHVASQLVGDGRILQAASQK